MMMFNNMPYSTGGSREPDLAAGPNLSNGAQIGFLLGKAIGELFNSPTLGAALGTGIGLAVGGALDLAAHEVRPASRHDAGTDTGIA